jgi:protease-4
MRVIKSGENKDIGSMWRDFAPGDREILEALIDDFYQRFLETVAKGRPELDPETIGELADGRVYTAKQAEEAGLIDGIKYLDEVIGAAREAAGLDDAAVVAYKRPRSYKGHIYADSPSAAPRAFLNVDADSLLDWASQPRFQYLWMP